MIRSAEIQKKANSERVRDTQIEKDYILSWILFGISRNSILSKSLGFKGGTVLKKFYFEDYRYSEDLDFTLVDSGINNEVIRDAFLALFEFVKDEANIPLSMEDFGIHETGNINFYVSYSGPLGGLGNNKRVKVDISRNELLKYDLQGREMFNTYSDMDKCTLLCYSLDEIMTEKMRSLLNRTQPRDYYDLWYLSKMQGMEMADHLQEFREKAIFKGFDPDSLEAKIESKSRCSNLDGKVP